MSILDILAKFCVTRDGHITSDLLISSVSQPRYLTILASLSYLEEVVYHFINGESFTDDNFPQKVCYQFVNPVTMEISTFGVVLICIILFLIILAPVVCCYILMANSNNRRQMTASITFVSNDQVQLKATSLDRLTECPVQLCGHDNLTLYPDCPCVSMEKRPSVKPILSANAI